jgi:hypothetical protein
MQACNPQPSCQQRGDLIKCSQLRAKIPLKQKKSLETVAAALKNGEVRPSIQESSSQQSKGDSDAVYLLKVTAVSVAGK